MNHPGVVRVRDYFTANGTAYIVMEYEVGESLSATLQRGGILPEPELRRLLNDMMPALEAVHAQGYLHRDIKPSNLYIRASSGQVILLDFGAARQALGRRTRSVTSVVTPGYSPIEQYVTVGDDYGPWTDIYATRRGAVSLHYRHAADRSARAGAQGSRAARHRDWRRLVLAWVVALGRSGHRRSARGSLPDHSRDAGRVAGRRSDRQSR